jgi:hypothetical protein
MRHIATLAAALASVTLAACGCSVYQGAGDRVYQRGMESMILCTNDGFVTNLTAQTIEGRYTYDGTMTVATRGDNHQTAFTLTDHADGTATAPELGVLAWERVTLDQTALDHAHVQCNDLETRAWWTAQ